MEETNESKMLFSLVFCLYDMEMGIIHKVIHLSTKKSVKTRKNAKKSENKEVYTHGTSV